MTIALILAAISAGLFFWPSGGLQMPTVSLFMHEPAAKSVAFAEAIDSLSIVQRRLAATDELGDAQRKAVDCLTLALVKGSVE
jgi:hypothetical protein